ncbi:MAG: glycosyltransferase family 2 protein [Candidatus Sericytochromatia bacterium]
MNELNKLSIIIPAYNEEKTIKLILKKVIDVVLVENIKKEILIIDDASKDNTYKQVEEFKKDNPNQNINLFRHEINQGKGAALHTGIKNATGDYLIVQDADLEYDPEEINILIQTVLKSNADVVYGSRFIGGKAHRLLFFFHTIGNKFLTFLCNIFSNLNMSDMETCYKLFKTSIIQQIKLEEKRFGFEPEVTIKISRVPKIKIYEVGISYYGRTYEEGKKINWKDGVRAIYCILKYGIFS